jgi:hypothetical protein
MKMGMAASSLGVGVPFGPPDRLPDRTAGSRDGPAFLHRTGRRAATGPLGLILLRVAVQMRENGTRRLLHSQSG